MSEPIHENERIKARSNYLRGTLAESLADTLTGAMSPDDTQISKFHGFYQQDHRDRRQERREQYLEPYFGFMLRARLPGGVCTPAQWLAIDGIGRELAGGSLRLTTRQSFQYHGILKRDITSVIRGINKVMIDSIGGCGDVNRNVLCNPNPVESVLHRDVYDWAKRISEHLLPQTRAYHEIWLDGEQVGGGEDVEPIYGKTYLPRKFKTAVAVPPHNDVDVYSNDLGFVAIAEGGRLIGFNVSAGGGMGATHGDTATFPRLADVLGFVEPDRTLAVTEAVVTVQRDFGDRLNRSQARLKYTIERMGLETFRAEVERRAGIRFEPARPVRFTDQGDRYGWVKGQDDRWHLTLYIESGRLIDGPGHSPMTGLREIARIHQGDFRITPNQNLIVARVPEVRKADIDALAREHGLLAEEHSPLRLNGISCVALPTCPLAMAEAERYYPDFLAQVERLTAKHGVADQEIVTRITGCPNGCARPYLAELALVGKGPGRYNLMLGGDGIGTRLNRLYRENLDEIAILAEIDTLLGRYAAGRKPGERFGDYLIRDGIVRPVVNPAEDFHA
ncbi:assimilatory sulfite reductase (NADPH) hemoprotein subunit [Thiocapsa rosea]|uniref:Sulfite reductase [NADPH] hemoprotein beta-component n=1 Tax=Thiocapsa rosea TaxID=69360 RepID=A0A495VCK3_9GAMM|nr:assimilatory sulfite reductase (NADPH) hemoprotein subunit [Thiocapsa rosea]RKT46353.1 sulfite reductase (NADPH) beta subunit [Thiocapsa rosea]